MQDYKVVGSEWIYKIAGGWQLWDTTFFLLAVFAVIFFKLQLGFDQVPKSGIECVHRFECLVRFLCIFFDQICPYLVF